MILIPIVFLIGWIISMALTYSGLASILQSWGVAVPDLNDLAVTLLIGVIKLLVWTLELVLAPFNALIASSMPMLEQGIASVSAMLDLVWTYMAWIINALPIPQLALNLVVSFYVFAFGLTTVTWVFKLILRWKNRL